MFVFLRGIFRRLRGRCRACGARNWRARNTGWTVPELACGECGHGANER